MPGLISFLLSVVLVIAATLVESATQVPIVTPLIIVTAIWAARDSTKIRLQEYQSGIALHPVALGVCIALLWIIGFPWYLAVRYRIIAGTQPPKTPLPVQ